jgi:hypothetical protein
LLQSPASRVRRERGFADKLRQAKSVAKGREEFSLPNKDPGRLNVSRQLQDIVQEQKHQNIFLKPGNNRKEGNRIHLPRTVSLVPPPNTQHCDTDSCKNPTSPLHQSSQSPTAAVLEAALMVLGNLRGKNVTSLRDYECIVTFFERSACVENCPPKCELFLYFIYG